MGTENWQRWQQQRQQQHRRVFIAFLLLGAILAVVVRYGFIAKHAGKTEALVSGLNLADSITIEGIILSEPDRRESSLRLFVDVEKIQAQKVRARVLVVTERYSAWQYGDRIIFSGKLEKPKNFESETGREFDYISYLAKDGILFEMFYPKMELTVRDQGSFLKTKLLKIKHAFVKKIEAAVPEPRSALLGGLLLGAKHSLGKDLLEDFRRAGVIHIVVLSGYNVTIVAEFIMRLAGFLPRFYAGAFGALGIVLFVIMTGAAAGVVRAGIMAVLVIVAKASGRPYAVGRALFVAAFLMLLENPRILFSDPSFQLSFLATIGLIYFSPIIEEKLAIARLIPEKFHLRELVVSTVTVQIFLLPILLYQTGMFSLSSLPANFLILTFIPLTMLAGFISGLAGFIFAPLAFPSAFVANFLAVYIIAVAQFFSRLPFSVFTIKNFPLWLVFAVYIFYFYIFYRFSRRERGKK